MKPHDATDLSQALFEEAGDALFLFDPETDQLVDANPTAQLLSGFTRQELLRFQAAYLFRSDGQGGMNRLRHAAHHTGPFHAQDGYLLRTKQDHVWVPVNLTMARLHIQPKTLGLITARDVREHRAAHQQLKHIEAELRRVMASVSDCLWSAEIDKHGQWNYRLLSPVVEKITGRSSDYFRTGLQTWRHVVERDDVPLWESFISQLRNGQSGQVEYRIVCEDGSTRWVRDSVLASRPETVGLLRLDGVLTDITAHKEAEAELARERDLLNTFMDNIPDLIYFKDTESRFTRINKAHAQYLGLNDWREAVGKTDQDFYPPECAGEFSGDERQLIATGQPLINKVERQTDQAGAQRWILTTKVPFFDRAGQVIGIVGVSKDVTAQKHIEEQLHQQRAEQQMIFDSVPALIWYKDRDNRIIRLNRPAAESMGCAADDLEGKSTYELYPEDASKYHDDDCEVMETGQAKRGIIEQLLTSSGERIWVQTDKVPHRNREGEIVGVVVFAVDITERKLAEEALRRAEEKYRGIFENAVEGIYQKAPTGRFAMVNPMAARILGFASPQQLLDYTRDQDIIFYADAERRDKFVRLLQEFGSVTNFESQVRRKDGSLAWISENTHVLRDAAGTLLGYEGTLIDITERKQAEAALAHERALLRSLIDSIPDLIFYKDRAGRYLGCNVAFERFAGRSKRDLMGRTDFDLLPRRDLAEFYQERDRQVVAEGKPRRDEEWIEYRDGRQMLVETMQTPFLGPSGQILGLIGMCRDITERKRLEEQLRQAQKMEAIGQLAGGVAHDFNNLLTAILGNVSLLLTGKPMADPEYELLAATEQAAQRATDLTRQLLGFSRQTMLRLEPANLNASVQEIVSILRRTIDPRIRVEIQTGADLWTVQADPGQMNQVLMNLCINARDAMPQGGRLLLETCNIELDETSRQQQLESRPGKFARLRVQDTGQGIPPEVQARIFEPFFTTKEPGKGTGLGLAMVYGIVKQHQGWIECASTVGQGTQFDIYLPRFADGRSHLPAPPASTTSGRGHETILLVDDEAVIRNVGKAILQRQGYDVLLAEDGQEAVEVYRRENGRIGLVILDLIMPRLSGQDTLRQLTQINANVPVLLSSGYSADQIPEVGKEGVLGFVNKPYRPQDLTNAVRTALDRAKTGAPDTAKEAGSWVI